MDELLEDQRCIRGTKYLVGERTIGEFNKKVDYNMV